MIQRKMLCYVRCYGAQRCYTDVTEREHSYTQLQGAQRCYRDVTGSIFTHSYREHSARQAAIDAAITKEYRKYKVGQPFEFRKGKHSLRFPSRHNQLKFSWKKLAQGRFLSPGFGFALRYAVF